MRRRTGRQIDGETAPRGEVAADAKTAAASTPAPESSVVEASAANLAHAINNPLTAVVMNLDLLAEVLAGDPRSLAARIGEARAVLSDARQAAESLRRVAGQIHRVAPHAAATFTSDEPITSNHPRRVRVLFVDDEPAIGRAVRRALHEYDVEAFISADGALARIESGERYDVIVSDLMMPQMTGMDFYDEVERLAPEQAARMIFFTGGATTTRALAFVASMSDRVMEKPCDAERLRALIRRRLAERRRDRADLG